MRHLKILILVLALIPTNALAQKGSAKKGPVDVLLMGSSTIGGPLGFKIEKALKDEGFTAAKSLKSSTGICRADFYDWRVGAVQRAKEFGIPKVAVLYLGGNDSQDLRLLPSEQKKLGRARDWVRFRDQNDEWRLHYENRMLEVIDSLCDLGVSRVIVLPTVAISREKHVKQQDVIRELQANAAKRSKCGLAMSTIPEVDKIPPGQLQKYRAKDGFHVTAEGATRVWNELQKPFIEEVKRVIPDRQKPTVSTAK